METKNMIVRKVPPAIHRDLKVLAAREGKTLQGLLVEILTEWVSRGRKKGE